MARNRAWKVHMRCANGYREGTRSIRRCVYRKQLDLDTLADTRGPNFPLSRLEFRLMCPAGGGRQRNGRLRTADSSRCPQWVKDDPQGDDDLLRRARIQEG